MREGLPSPMLRVDYAIVNAALERRFNGYILKDKAISAESLIPSASLADSLCDLEFSALRGRFSTHVLPVYTIEDFMGSRAERAGFT